MLKSNNRKVFYTGTVIKNLPNSNFLVKIDEISSDILCYISGKIRINYIRIVPGDLVKVELDKFDFSKGRIIYRLA